jgi:hypothetical protein
MHTVDPFNGNPSLGVGNYLFSSAVAAGPVTISGMVWDASLFYGTARPQDWSLLLNGVVIDVVTYLERYRTARRRHLT